MPDSIKLQNTYSSYNKNFAQDFDNVNNKNDCVVIDLEDGILKIYINENLKPDYVWRGRLERNKFRNYLDKDSCSERVKIFKKGLNYLTFNKIIDIMKDEAQKREYKLYISNNLQQYISERELHIFELSRVGLDIKKRNENVIPKFNKYKEIVNAQMERPLREQQMWDSFFMCTLNKSANFSVPGSGKTASVLGVFAFLKSQNIVDKIVMIGQKTHLVHGLTNLKFALVKN